MMNKRNQPITSQCNNVTIGRRRRDIMVTVSLFLHCQYLLFPIIGADIIKSTVRYKKGNRVKRQKTNRKKYYDPISKRIVGGTVVQSNTKYPWFTVSAGRELCGSTLIHPDILLTAAHCQGAFVLKGAMIGGLLLNGTDPDMVYSTAANEYYHSQYNESMNLMNDIMLVKLSNPVTDDIPLIPYNTNVSLPGRLELVTILGYGLTAETNSTASATLLDATLNVVPYEYCKHLFQYLDNDRMICAGVPDGSKDACQGDSGGPLIIDSSDVDSSSAAIQIGITSFGIGCGRPDMPAVYTRVSYYQNWIIDGICTVSSVPLNDPAICNNVKGSFIYNMTTQATASPTITSTQVSSSKPSITPTSSKPTYTPTTATSSLSIGAQNSSIPTLSPTSNRPISESTSTTAPRISNPITPKGTSRKPTQLPSSPSAATKSLQPSILIPTSTTFPPSSLPITGSSYRTNVPTTMTKSKTPNPVKSPSRNVSISPTVIPSTSVLHNTAIPTTIQQIVDEPTSTPSSSLDSTPTPTTITPIVNLTYPPVSPDVPSLNMRNSRQRWKIKCVFLAIARKKNATTGSSLDTTSAIASLHDDEENKYIGIKVPQISSINDIKVKNSNVKNEIMMMAMRRRSFKRNKKYDADNVNPNFNATAMSLLFDDLNKYDMDNARNNINNETELNIATNLTKFEGSVDVVNSSVGHAAITSEEEAAYRIKKESNNTEFANNATTQQSILTQNSSVNNVFLKRES
jgi:secreted trypsin-like serine protease